ncbi:MAG TPA: fused MFS/spermidine synthase [Polyangiaceae bacterium]|nr:fused MFS/spermidine synthase [Polyangiaceae bacterium]
MLRRLAPTLLMFASGFAGLGYQIVWTEQNALWLGHEATAILAVVAAFFGGLALGGWSLGARIEQSPRPRRWYAGCELLIGVWGLALVVAGPAPSRVVLALSGLEPSLWRQWSAAFTSCLVLFLPATAAMGATLPAMERLSATLRGQRSLAALYAANTAGAVLGVLATAFWLVPAFGLRRTALGCVGLNLACALLAAQAFPKRSEAVAAPEVSPRASAWLLRLAATGLLGIGYEVLVVRVLSQVTEDTVYTFALLLAVYLVGTAVGAAAYERWLVARKSRELDERLFAAQAVAVLVGTATLWSAERVRDAASDLLGASASAHIAVEGLLALLAFGPATVVMGALFSHLTKRAHAAGVSFGRALGVNTLAAACAPALFGVVAVPLAGPTLTLLAVALGYLALSAPRSWRTPQIVAPGLAVLALAVLAPPLRFVEVPGGGHIVSYREGPVAAVSVVEDAQGVARLRIDNRQQEGSSASLRVDARQAWLPLLFHAAPRRALFLGMGTGVTSASAAADPTLQVDVVELLPEVLAASERFIDAESRQRLHAIVADARRYVRLTSRRYDVIVSDNFHPARSGSGSLYTVEHFQAVRERLTEEGVFCQWLPLHQLDLASLRSIAASFVRVYPQAFAILASNSLETPVIGLLARRDGARFDAISLKNRLVRAALPELIHSLGLEDEYAVLGGTIAGTKALRHFSEHAIANTDDRPWVAYQAPFITYAPDSSPRERLLALLGEVSLDPAELLQPSTDQLWQHRLAAYWQARDQFIRSGRDVKAAPRVEDMLAQVREPLLSVLRISPDFRPAYDPLLGMASALARSNVSGARSLLGELRQLQPARLEAAQLLTQIDAFRKSESPVRLPEP